MELRSGKILSKSRDKVRQSHMNGDEFSMPLPEELVERILAMVSFPQIFKARVLSKSWHARLSSTSSHDDKETKLLAMCFQKRVSEWSDKWPTLCPVFLFNEFLIAYDRGSQRWRKISILSVLSYRDRCVMVHMLRHFKFFSSIVGALLLVRDSPCSAANLFVMNIFTGSRKKLPACPYMKRRLGVSTRLLSREEGYKVITLSLDVGCASAWIYDNKLCAWRSQILKAPEVLENFHEGWFDAYLNGVLYVMVFVEAKIWGFLAFDVKDETVHLLHMPHIDIIRNHARYFVEPVACNGTLYIVVPEGISVHDSSCVSTTVTLVEADLVSRRWLKVIRGPPVALNFGLFSNKASSDGDYLFFEGQSGNQTSCRNERTSSGKILAYHVRKDEWSVLDMDPNFCKYLVSVPHSNFDFGTSFQPGINTFLEV